MALIPFVDMMCTSLLDRDLNRQPKRLSSTQPTSLPGLEDINIHWLMDKDILNLAADRPRAVNEIPRPQRKKEDFQVMLDVQHFKPEEIDVKVVDNYLVVTAKHEGRQDEHGWVSRQFVRRYQLPESIDVEQLTSELSSDGLLTIVAPKKQPDEIQRTLRIECTGKPFMNKKQEKPKTQSEMEIE